MFHLWLWVCTVHSVVDYLSWSRTSGPCLILGAPFELWDCWSVWLCLFRHSWGVSVICGSARSGDRTFYPYARRSNLAVWQPQCFVPCFARFWHMCRPGFEPGPHASKAWILTIELPTVCVMCYYVLCCEFMPCMVSVVLFLCVHISVLVSLPNGGCDAVVIGCALWSEGRGFDPSSRVPISFLSALIHNRRCALVSLFCSCVRLHCSDWAHQVICVGSSLVFSFFVRGPVLAHCNACLRARWYWFMCIGHRLVEWSMGALGTEKVVGSNPSIPAQLGLWVSHVRRWRACFVSASEVPRASALRRRVVHASSVPSHLVLALVVLHSNALFDWSQCFLVSHIFVFCLLWFSVYYWVLIEVVLCESIID